MRGGGTDTDASVPRMLKRREEEKNQLNNKATAEPNTQMDTRQKLAGISGAR
jgi:hypothetical protein